MGSESYESRDRVLAQKISAAEMDDSHAVIFVYGSAIVSVLDVLRLPRGCFRGPVKPSCVAGEGMIGRKT